MLKKYIKFCIFTLVLWLLLLLFLWREYVNESSKEEEYEQYDTIVKIRSYKNSSALDGEFNYFSNEK